MLKTPISLRQWNHNQPIQLQMPTFITCLSIIPIVFFISQLLKCLVLCLQKDQHCFSKWRQMYVNNMAQSGVLMTHLLNEWSQVSRKVKNSNLPYLTLDPRNQKPTITT